MRVVVVLLFLLVLVCVVTWALAAPTQQVVEEDRSQLEILIFGITGAPSLFLATLPQGPQILCVSNASYVPGDGVSWADMQRQWLGVQRASLHLQGESTHAHHNQTQWWSVMETCVQDAPSQEPGRAGCKDPPLPVGSQQECQQLGLFSLSTFQGNYTAMLPLEFAHTISHLEKAYSRREDALLGLQEVAVQIQEMLALRQGLFLHMPIFMLVRSVVCQCVFFLWLVVLFRAGVCVCACLLHGRTCSPYRLCLCTGVKQVGCFLKLTMQGEANVALGTGGSGSSPEEVLSQMKDHIQMRVSHDQVQTLQSWIHHFWEGSLRNFESQLLAVSQVDLQPSVGFPGAVIQCEI